MSDWKQAVWTVRKERQKKRPSKLDLAEAARRYLNAGKTKTDLSKLLGTCLNNQQH